MLSKYFFYFSFPTFNSIAPTSTDIAKMPIFLPFPVSILSQGAWICGRRPPVQFCTLVSTVHQKNNIAFFA